MLYYERKFKRRGFNAIIGVDEAGRGPLAGPIVAAAVRLKQTRFKNRIDDSKKLSEEKRNELFETIKNEALDYGIGIVHNEKIDEINILNATYLAMKKAINNLNKEKSNDIYKPKDGEAREILETLLEWSVLHKDGVFYII